MKDAIIQRLEKFERETGAHVILAVESGSRGWGFSSADSDYDVRFVYKYPIPTYLNLQKPSDCFSWIEGECDYEGFDIYKFYDLLYKSNMNIIDWLMQDVIYIDHIISKDALKKTVETRFNRRTYAAHNFGLANKNFSKYFNNPSPNEPTVKRYVYCLRALLSAKYVMKYEKLAPLKFDDLIQKTLTKEEIAEVREMVELKKNTKEKQTYENAKWRKFIEENLKNEIKVQPQTTDQHSEFYKELNQHLLTQVREA